MKPLRLPKQENGRLTANTRSIEDESMLPKNEANSPKKFTTAHGRFSFALVVTGMVWTILALITIAIPALYLLIHFQYQNGLIDSAANINAKLIAELSEENPGWLVTKPSALERFVNEDVVFKSTNSLEDRVIFDTDNNVVFARNKQNGLTWPVIVHRSRISANNTTLGYFLVARSLTHIVHNAVGLALLSLVFACVAGVCLQRYLVRRLRSAEESLSQHVKYDALTGLPNRHEAIAELQLRLQRHPLTGSIAVFFIGLDKFRAINDSYGHAAGDEILKATATVLKTCIRSDDFLGRLSSDEFIVVATVDSVEEAIARIGHEVTVALAGPQRCSGRELSISATIGVAYTPVHGMQAEQLIQRADTAMNSLKSQRRTGWTVYETVMTEKLEREMHMRTRLKFALQRDEFEIEYQPLLRLQDDQVIGAEALLRWRDSETGALVSPAEFIAELEDSGLIVPVGAWVLRMACRRAAQWRQTHPAFHIAVNVSARQFIEDGFVASVAQILFEEHVAPDAIEIELTESMLLDEALTSAKLKQLKKIGVRLALDDFGTGFSSLGRLASMPFDVIKIDRQFINQMDSGERERSVIVSILALSRGLGMVTLSEGIETAAQREALLKLKCERGQGFLFSKPISADAFYSTYIQSHMGMAETALEMDPDLLHWHSQGTEKYPLHLKFSAKNG